jgi:hypothetical protein
MPAELRERGKLATSDSLGLDRVEEHRIFRRRGGSFRLWPSIEAGVPWRSVCQDRAVSTPSPANDAPRPGADADRGVGEILLTALTCSALVPFIQAIATKTGEDVYAKIRHLLKGRREVRPDAENTIVLVDRKTATVLEIPSHLSEKDARRLATVPMPSVPASHWLCIRYDPASRSWTATPVTAPSPDAIEIDDRR